MKSPLPFLCFTFILTLAALANAQDDSVMSAKYREFWNADVQAQIDANIEKNRKADARFVLENAAPGTEVQVVQKTHAFRF